MKQTNRNMKNQKWVTTSVCFADAPRCPSSTNIQGELSAQSLYNKLGLQVWCSELSGGYVRMLTTPDMLSTSNQLF